MLKQSRIKSGTGPSVTIFSLVHRRAKVIRKFETKNKFSMKNQIKKIAERIAHIPGVEKIILFGSYAYGKPHEDSDVDLLVIAENKPTFRERVQISSALFDEFLITIQMVWMTIEEFEETKEVIGGIAYPAYNYGIVLYEKSRTGNKRLRPAVVVQS